jgi:hypothetical protein
MDKSSLCEHTSACMRENLSTVLHMPGMSTMFTSVRQCILKKNIILCVVLKDSSSKEIKGKTKRLCTCSRNYIKS